MKNPRKPIIVETGPSAELSMPFWGSQTSLGPNQSMGPLNSSHSGGQAERNLLRAHPCAIAKPGPSLDRPALCASLGHSVWIQPGDVTWELPLQSTVKLHRHMVVTTPAPRHELHGVSCCPDLLADSQDPRTIHLQLYPALGPHLPHSSP